MAEINIEKKKTPIWRWLLVLILLALIGWAIYEFVLKPQDADPFVARPGTGLVIPVPVLKILI